MITAIHRALAAKREALKNDDRGFTLIELLVVVLIIGILTAIAVPVFLGQQNQAKESATKSDLGNAKVALISYATANNGNYTDDETLLPEFGFVQSENTNAGTLTIVLGSASGEFCIEAQSSTSTWFHIDHDGGADDGDCTP